MTKALGAPAIVEDGCRKTTFTHRLNPADLDDLRGVEVTAHQFQRGIPKSLEARLIVAGNRVFAAGIHSESEAAYVDRRNNYAALRYEKLEPPVGVAAGVLEYCVELGLMYGAFDFTIRPDGEWVFLECNSRRNPGRPRPPVLELDKSAPKARSKDPGVEFGDGEAPPPAQILNPGGPALGTCGAGSLRAVDLSDAVRCAKADRSRSGTRSSTLT